MKKTAFLIAACAFAHIAFSQSKTAQSVQINTEGVEQALNFDQEQVWRFDFNPKWDAIAAFSTYFTLSGTSANQTHTENAMMNAFKDNKCAFFHGTPLVAITTKQGASTLVATPVSSTAYPAKTGWTLTSSTATAIALDVSNIFVASESLLIQTTGKNKTTKYSFSMTDDLGVSRLTKFTVTLVKDGVDVDTRDLLLSQTVEQGVDWLYIANAGTFGNNDAKASLLSGQNVSAILLADNFAGNNGVGGTRANIPNQSFTLDGSGNYTLRIAVTIKGNSADTTQSITVTVNAAIVGGCN
jgi:hypothetical protein